MTDPGTLALHADALEDSSWRVRLTTLQTLRQLEPATLAQYTLALYTDAIVARLEDSSRRVREAALKALGELEPARLAQYAFAVVARLEDSG